jgi:ABC-type nickel/cobalt efflux system permease component RcnA
MRTTEPSHHDPRGSIRVPSVWIRCLAALATWIATVPASAHDIPNARVDRSIQVTVRPGRLEIVYEVALAELTLTQELRTLVGSLAGADRRDVFQRYGQETGPLNAKGLLVTCNGEPRTLTSEGFDLVVEEHPRFFFRYATPIAPAGRLRVRDTNFASSEGTSRLAIRGAGVTLRGDALAPDVESIPARPLWQLSDEEERRTRDVAVDYQTASSLDARLPEARRRDPAAVSNPASVPEPPSRLSRLLDDASRLPLALLVVIAAALGAAHAIQPGHGKTLVATTAIAGGGDWQRSLLLALLITITHAGSVFVLAWILWWTGTRAFSSIHLSLARAAGFAIAAVGLWRVGRWLAGFSEHDPGDEADGRIAQPRARLLALGLAGGAVPCWDAVGLVVLAAAVGRLGLGVVLAAAFSAGMGLILAAVGFLVSRIGRPIGGPRWREGWERRISLASGLVLSALGLVLLRS